MVKPFIEHLMFKVDLLFIHDVNCELTITHLISHILFGQNFLLHCLASK